MGSPIRSDREIIQVIERATESRFDYEILSGRHGYRWGLRELNEYDSDSQHDAQSLLSVALARSVLTQSGQTVTDEGIEEALSQLSPPAADVIHLIFYMKRHFVLVEYSSAMLSSDLWRKSLHEILDSACRSMEKVSEIRLEPLPRNEEITKAFQSFDTLTRLRVKLRIPNPELDRRTERLRKDMRDGGIREYLQDMKNPAGLSRDENGLPFASTAMAQAGYKDGEVVMSGSRGGRRITVRTGGRARRVFVLRA